MRSLRDRSLRRALQVKPGVGRQAKRGNKVKSALELHDSRIGQVALADGVATVHFSHAYIHKSAGTPGKDAGTGWSQEVQLVLSEAECVGALPSVPNTIADGYLEVGGIRHELIPLPFTRRARARLALMFVDGTQLEINGARPFIELLGKPTFLEDVP